MRSIVASIVKNKTRDFSDKANYRPISLATRSMMVLDGVLERRNNKTTIGAVNNGTVILCGQIDELSVYLGFFIHN